MIIKKGSSYSSAFTLIELLTVAAIIIIIAGAIVINLNMARKKSRDATRKSDLKQMQTAIESYATDHGKYYSGATASLAGNSSAAGIPALENAGWTSLQSQLSSYIPKLPLDPRNKATSQTTPPCRSLAAVSNSIFCYEFKTAADSYYLTASLETASGNGDQFLGNIGPDTYDTFFGANFPTANKKYLYILESHPQ